MGPYKLLCVLMDSNGILWVLIIQYASLTVPICFYRSVRDLMGLYGSL